MTMTPRITLTFTAGPLKAQDVVFTGTTLCTVGRSPDCHLQLRGSDGSLTVSRRHCLLDIRPSSVRVLDLDSRNGTFLNGRKIGPHEQETAPAPADLLRGVELHDGDQLRVGDSEFVISIETAPSEDEDESVRVRQPSNPRCLACC
jgi:pSer/pThr/pTyr-binding forkhead associated (FHA) protein